MRPDRAASGAPPRGTASIVRFWQAITFERVDRLRPIEAALFLAGYIALTMAGLSLTSALAMWVIAS